LEVIGSRIQPHSRKLPATYSDCVWLERGSEVRLDHAINFGPIGTGKEGKHGANIADLFTKCQTKKLQTPSHVVSPDSRNPSPIRKLPKLQTDPPKFRSSYPILNPLIYYRTALMYRPSSGKIQTCHTQRCVGTRGAACGNCMRDAGRGVP
jgi:hypothetical protein